MSRRCCGADVLVLRLCEPDGGSGGPVDLHRCAVCGRRSYVQDGTELPPADAFAVMAGTFQGVEPTEEAHARRVALAASRRVAPTAPATRRRRPARPARPEPAEVAEVADVSELLAGWTVLGR
jgi:hypothetical protein